MDPNPRVDVAETTEDGTRIIARDDCERTGGADCHRRPVLGGYKHHF
jgi:hypothetical protein